MTTTTTPENELLTTASSYCATRGILMQSPSSSSSSSLFTPAPYSLHPTPFPRHAFQKVHSLSFNRLVHAVASDDEWLRSSLRIVADGDAEFTGRLLTLADEVCEEGRVQRLVLGILRSDYMLHNPSSSSNNSLSSSCQPLQVELNTIASSFGCLSTKISRMHRYIYHQNLSKDDLPENDAAGVITNGLARAYKEYVKRRRREDGRCCVVMVVQEGERNSCDQRDLEFMLQEDHGVPLVRRTLGDMAKGRYNESQELILGEGDDEIIAAVVYYRAGYTPNDYPTEDQWKGRWMAEKSMAIKCPDVFYHLVGTKKMQQILATPNILSRYIPNPTDLSSTFTGLYSLGDGTDHDILQSALSHPERYVLKPQREGGGNNLYDDELKAALQKMSETERKGFILMEKIVSPRIPGGVLVRGGEEVVYRGDCVCELGVFGVSLRSYPGGEEEEEVLVDDVGGFILRSKSVGTDEGGVAAGYAFLSSPLLV